MKLNLYFLVILIFLNINAFSNEKKMGHIYIESDELINTQNPQLSKFTGNVYANDGINHFWGEIMIIEYDDNNKVKLITLKNSVKIKRINEEANGDFALYDPKKESIEIFGNVAVTKDNNLLRGEKLTIDLISSTSIITGTESKQVSVKIIK